MTSPPTATPMKVTVATNEVFFNGVYDSANYNAGDYTVEVRAWADNNHYTSEFYELQIKIVDPC